MPEGSTCNKEKEGLKDSELKEIIDIFGSIGLNKIRFTGGEPLLRKSIVDLVEFARDKGIKQIALTTNGILLDRYLDNLCAAGLTEVNISLDSLKADRFKAITRGGDFSKVMNGINRAIEKGLKVKINTVIIKDINEDEFIDLCKVTTEKNLDMRFIELMPIGEGIKYVGVSGKVLTDRLKGVYALKELKREVNNGPAIYYKIQGAKGRVGFISPLTNHFCDECNRIRVTSDGILKQCLHFNGGLDLKVIFRSTLSREEKETKIKETIYNKPQGHRFIEDKKTEDNRFMFQIGG